MQVSTCWAEPLVLDHSLPILGKLASRHAREGGEHGARILRLLESGDYAGIVHYELPVSAPGWNACELINCRQALGFFQKLEDIEIGIDKKAVAFRKFVESEEKCRETNTLLRALSRGSVVCRPRDVRLLEAARRKIRAVLGRCPSYEELDLRFGPGATTSIKRSQSSPQRKFAAGLVCSDNFLHLGGLHQLVRECPHWTYGLGSHYSIDDDGYLVETVAVDLHHGRLEFVPKNAKSFRSIVVEPALNGFVQAGIGKWIKQRLLRAGVDISDQSRNASLARIGSQTNHLATLDLSSASDTVSYELVKYLLPTDWFNLLATCRSASVVYEGRVIHLEKFSSMGNGFTFPLETLLFWALTVSRVPYGGTEDVGVYGDDIICPAIFAGDVISGLEFCGFSVNTEKSFVEGPFRESCGHDYYLGIETRPFYQKHLVSGATLFALHNFYRRNYDDEGCQLVKQFIPRSIRLYGPDGYGDGHLVSDDWPAIRDHKMIKKGYCGVRFETYSLTGRREISRFPGDYVSPLYSIYRKAYAPLHESVPGLSESSPVSMHKDGRPIWTLPGVDGYKRVSIYTLNV